MMNMIRINETDYARQMQTVVLPYLEKRKESGDFERIPGQNIHYRVYTADEPRGELVLLHGFSEGIDKFNEMIFCFLQAGFRVWQIQQRGHGTSFREVTDPSLVHIRDYRDLVEDLHYFVTEIVKKGQRPDLPRYFFGHSMGGAVGAVCLETYPEDFRKAVLSSPMLELDSGNTPIWLAVIFAGIMTLLGKDKNYMPGSLPFRSEPDFENSCSNCQARYEYWFSQTCQKPEYQTCALTIGTCRQFLELTKTACRRKNCEKVQAEVLLLQAGEDTLVKPGGQETFIRQIGTRGRLVKIEHAKHEIYMSTDEILERYWKEILGFLQPDRSDDSNE